jgi:purine-nucleoside phosphorylase
MNDEWNKVDQITSFLAERLGDPPAVHVVLGSGLGSAAGQLEGCREIEFTEIPGWPRSTVEGHAGKLLRGAIAGVEVLIQSGRIHLYEGYSPAAVTRPVRAAIGWGARTVILTNAAGGVGTAAKPGDLMVLEDHINLTGRNPLRGPNDDQRGPRFPDMTDIYDRGLRALALDRAAELGITLRTGVYAGMPGPSYETPAEVKMLESMGITAVGMSTVLEAISARHLGARLVGISCITNQAATTRGAKLTHAEVQAIGAKASDDITRLVVALIAAMEHGP